MPWGTHADEDAHEWAQAIYGALRRGRPTARSSPTVRPISYPAALHLELSKDEDDIWTLVIRRRLAYLHTGAEERERWLTNGEIHALFRHLAGQPDEDDYEFENPPHPKRSSSPRSTSSAERSHQPPGYGKSAMRSPRARSRLSSPNALSP